MATLQKFKPLSTHCGVAPSLRNSPQPNPTTISRRSQSSLIPSTFLLQKKNKKKEKEKDSQGQ
uniref:Uncharacterized protein n=1 Tax=Fagus sylvatica TaxID=28930 RepID=A0A2N9J7Z3_FAGSY